MARVWTIGELTRRIKELLETEIDQVWVTGEISGWKVHPSSGHAYFNLKDARALISCVCWASTVRSLASRMRPRDGQKVRAFGRITVYEPRGSYQLVIEQMLDEGEGALQAAFQRLKMRLEAEGLFAPARKRKLPPFPRRIGIITSPSGAALHDMLRILGRRWPLAEVILRPAAVQGAEAAAELATAVRELDECGHCDVLIVGRGGGSLEDLWAFNEEVLARAIFGARTPVVSAVGHEVDFTIADFVADLRAATPSNAAELVVPDREEVLALLRKENRFLRSHLDGCVRRARLRLDRLRMSRGLGRPEELLRASRLDLDRLADRLRQGLSAPAERGKLRVQKCERRLWRADPSPRVSSARQRVTQAGSGLGRACLTALERARRRAELSAARLLGLSPERVLARGYAIVSRAQDGRIVRRAEAVRPGDGVRVRLHAGGLRCTVEETSAEPPGEAPATEPRAGEANQPAVGDGRAAEKSDARRADRGRDAALRQDAKQEGCE